MMINEWLLLTLGALLLLDVGTTVNILKHGGREVNPLLKRWFHRWDVQSALAFSKVGVLMFCAYANDRWGIPVLALVAVVAIQAIVVCWNLHLILARAS